MVKVVGAKVSHFPHPLYLSHSYVVFTPPEHMDQSGVVNIRRNNEKTRNNEIAIFIPKGIICTITF